MKILVVEDDQVKREYIEKFLKSKNIDIHICSSVLPALKYILAYLDEISGVVLDLGLTTYDDSCDYYTLRGLLLVEELTRKKIKIPILINSSTQIDIASVIQRHQNVKGQMYFFYDDERLERFINLIEREW